MDEFGELLYGGKTDNNKNGYAFAFLGVALIVAANFIYAKVMFMIFGGVFVLVGLYLLLFKRSEKISIYENVITLTSKGQEFAIAKEEIVHIEYRELKARRGLVSSYYPVLVLKDQNQILINKAFNAVINRDFKRIIQSYL